MSFDAWIKLIESAEKTSVIQGKLRKIHYTFPDGNEMAEEYSLETGVVLRRAWKKKKELSGESDWTIELGEKIMNIKDDNNFLVRESITEPILTKRVTKNNIEFRIRNLPYPIEVYSVSANEENKSITVRTTNKKYFKNIKIEELERCGILPKQANISVMHQYNTLIITYKKPQLVLEMEKAILLELKDVETTTDLDVDCSDLLQQIMG